MLIKLSAVFTKYLEYISCNDQNYKTLVLASLLEEENYFITELLNLGYLDPLECQIFAIIIRHFRFFIDSFHFSI